MGVYKDGILLYQKKLIKQGYGFFHAFKYDNIPSDLQLEDVHGWNARREILKWIKNKGFKDYKLVRANGYWRDLHGEYVYELWVSNKELKEYRCRLISHL